MINSSDLFILNNFTYDQTQAAPFTFDAAKTLCESAHVSVILSDITFIVAMAFGLRIVQLAVPLMDDHPFLQRYLQVYLPILEIVCYIAVVFRVLFGA